MKEKCQTSVVCMNAMEIITKKENKEKVFRLPKDPTERERWIKIIPRDDIPDNPNTVICHL